MATSRATHDKETKYSFFVFALLPLLFLGISCLLSDDMLLDIFSRVSPDKTIENISRLRHALTDTLLFSSLMLLWFCLILSFSEKDHLQLQGSRRLTAMMYASFCAAALGVSAFIVHRYISTLPIIFRKEGMLEILTAVCFFAASIIFSQKAIMVWRSRTRIGHTLILVFLTFGAVACLFVALEEVSWGQHYLEFETPEWIKDRNYQLEFTAHNFLQQDHLDFLSHLILWSLFGAVIMLVMSKRFFRNEVLDLVTPDMNFAGFSLTIAFAGTILHLELAEFLLSVAAVYYAVSTGHRLSSDLTASQRKIEFNQVRV